MGDIFEESEKLYFGRTLHPHCKTCVCPQEIKVQSKITLTSRKLRNYQLSPRQRKEQEFKKCICSGRRPLEDDWSDISSEGSQTQSPSPTRGHKRPQTHHKFGLLEKWFKRFDFDSNGLIDLFELRTMLNILGVTVGDGYCKRLLERADRDGDGRLTFSEFLMMWRQAQTEEELLEIIREYDLFPDVILIESARKQRPKSSKVNETVKRKYGRQRACCGCESTITKTLHRSSEESIEYENKVLHRPHAKLPVFSCYR